MPNGNPMEHVDPDGWVRWRARLDETLLRLDRWTQNHEKEEFGYHSRVETHMQETKMHIAAAAESRVRVDEKLDALEDEYRAMLRDMSILKVKVAWTMGAAWIAAAVAGFLAVEFFYHMAKGS